MFSRMTIMCIYCRCGKQLTDQEMYLFDILDGLCKECFDSAMEAAYEDEE